MANLKVLCIHGVGRHAPGDARWQSVWRDSITWSLAKVNPDAVADIHFVEHDDLFERDPPNTLDYLRAVAELLRGRFGWSARGLTRGELSRQISARWTAGMVAQWVTDDQLREQTRKRLLGAIRTVKPDVIAAHSLGSLIAYDTLRLHRANPTIQKSTLITFGSQIGNPFVTNELGGRIAALDVRHWYHLYNVHDRVFTAPLRVAAANFEQITTTFGGPFDGDVNHGVKEYLTHRNAITGVWEQLAGRVPVRALPVTRAGFVARDGRPPDRKALLVGINQYPDPPARLEGCVNDAFRLSAALQECGFEPDDIRLLLNERATAAAIRERLEWLLDDVRPGDVRVFTFSGHGARIPSYGIHQEVDGFDECLVPWDFDWSSPETLILDDWLYDLYSQLPYEATFLILFDCCHSGGLTRAGGPKVRMLDPPDDIRHRALQWDRELGMWVQRDIPPLIPEASGKWKVEDYAGSSRAVRRLGRSVRLRRHDNTTYDRLRRKYDHAGPYLPMMLQACQEHQVAFEYHNGAAAHGAFTFCLTKVLRDAATQRRSLTFDQLCVETSQLLRTIGYSQDPLVIGPKHLRDSEIPFAARKSPPATRRREARRKKTNK